jgi:hypothetical protein
MTDAPARDAAQDALAISADTMAHDFVAALLAELRAMPDHWARLAQEKQQAIIERLKEKVRLATGKAVHLMLRSEFPAVPAELDGINLKNGITATVKIAKDALYRHSLFDAQGTQVLMVVADPERWMNRIDEIKAKDDQLEMFSGDYDPSVDQPSYRRDQDRVAPAGVTWDKLKAQLTTPKPGDPPKPEEPAGQEQAPSTDAQPDGEAPLLFGSAATEDEERRAALGMLQEQLAAIGIALSIGTIQAWTADEMRVVREWADVYAKTPAGEECPIARPHWLPIPDLKGDAK